MKQYQDHVSKLENGSKVIFIHRNLFDVVAGIGWDTIGRFRLIKGKMIHVSGDKQTKETRDQLERLVTQ